MDSVGLSIDPELLAEVEEGLEYGDARSPRICELIELGLLVETTLDEYDLELPESEMERKSMLRQLVIDAGWDERE